MNAPELRERGPLTGIIRFLAIVGLLTIFAFGVLTGCLVMLMSIGAF